MVKSPMTKEELLVWLATATWIEPFYFIDYDPELERIYNRNGCLFKVEFFEGAPMPGYIRHNDELVVDYSPTPID